MRSKKQQVPVKDVVHDILGGLTDLELMTKYRIVWASDLYRLFNRLIMMGVVEKEEIKNRLPEGWKVKWKSEKSHEACDLHEEVTHLDARSARRSKFFGRIEICDMSGGTCSYGIEIKDISECGIMVAPLKIAKNEVREFMIKPTLLDDVRTISFVAECRWTDGIRAGFKIAEISPASLTELQKLITLFSFEGL